MASWRELVSQGMQTDIARKRASPAVINFGEILRTAMSLGVEKKKEVRTEAAATRGLARQSVFQRYPEVAAQEAGLDVPPAVAPTAPEGTELSQVTYDEAGRPVTTFKAPPALDEKTLGVMYNNTVLEIRKHNAIWAGQEDQQIPIPTFGAWKKEQFPNLLDEGPIAAGEGSALDRLKPDDIPLQDWDLATIQEKMDLLEDRGLL